MAHSLPALAYAFDALEPHIDAQTMQFHHEKHHGTAVETLNKAVTGSDAEHKTLEDLLANISAYPVARNSAGSHYNHSLFWQILAPAGIQPSGDLAAAGVSDVGHHGRPASNSGTGPDDPRPR